MATREDIVDLPAVLGMSEQVDKQGAGNCTHDERASRVHHIRSRAHSNQSGQRTVVHEARIVFSRNQSRQSASDHGHQGVDGDQAV